MAKNDSRTRAFTTTAKPKAKKKSRKSKKRIRQQIVISIFAIIALILVVFATLIIGKIITLKKEGQPDEVPSSVYTVPCTPEDVKKGNLLIINDTYQYALPDDLSNMIDVWQYRKNDANKNFIQINGNYTYALTSVSIALNQETLDAFNKMILDYCNSEGFTSENDTVISNLEIAWGGYSEATRAEYTEDISNYGKDYYDHALGTAMTLKINSPSTPLKESNLAEDFSWICQNAHRYGFIIRYPDNCQGHTGIDSSKRVHLRYIGVEHATYIFEHGCCLEEYLKMLRENHGSNNPLEFTAGGKTYNVYYVASSGNPTNVPVPEDKTYYISGDNMNGFIVTVVK